MNLPTDDLEIIITKNFSDKQISLAKNIKFYYIKMSIDLMIKCLNVLKDVDELSLSSGKSININLIKVLKNE